MKNTFPPQVAFGHAVYHSNRIDEEQETFKAVFPSSPQFLATVDLLIVSFISTSQKAV